MLKKSNKMDKDKEGRDVDLDNMPEEYYYDSEMEDMEEDNNDNTTSNNNDDNHENVQQYVTILCEKYDISKCDFITRGPNWIKHSVDSFTSLWIRFHAFYITLGTFSRILHHFGYFFTHFTSL